MLNGDRGFEGVVDVVDVDVGWAGNTCWVTASGDAGCTNDRPPSETFESVSVGWLHQCGITTDHALRCWSSHATFDGGCHAGPGACGRDPLPIEGRFVEVSAGAQHTCARSEDGEVLCFGARDTAAMALESDGISDESRHGAERRGAGMELRLERRGLRAVLGCA
ncbi:MAG: hypothetical protein H6720_29525 [Sandaracinus sp.]|nr:hypothetical protein [Sandaracinus sp.]